MLARAGPGRKKHHTPAADGGQHAVRHTGLRRRKRYENKTVFKRDTLYLINADAVAHEDPGCQPERHPV